MARPKIKITENEGRSIEARYKHGAGLVALSKNFAASVTVIRRILRERKVRVRGRGRPTNG